MGHLTAIQRSSTLEAAAAARSAEAANNPARLTPAQQAAMALRLAQLNNALGEPDFNRLAPPAASNASEFEPPRQSTVPSPAKIAAIALLLITGVALALTQMARAPSLPLSDIQHLATAPRGAIPAPTIAPTMAPTAVVATTPAETTASAAPPVAETLVSAAPIAPEIAIKAALDAWQQAWAGRDVAAYLALYADAFMPADGSRRSDWVAARTKKLVSGAPITLTLNAVSIEASDNARFKVSFLQDYAAGSYRESARPKTLEFAQENGAWKIVVERQESTKPATR